MNAIPPAFPIAEPDNCEYLHPEQTTPDTSKTQTVTFLDVKKLYLHHILLTRVVSPFLKDNDNSSVLETCYYIVS